MVTTGHATGLEKTLLYSGKGRVELGGKDWWEDVHDF